MAHQSINFPTPKLIHNIKETVALNYEEVSSGIVSYRIKRHSRKPRTVEIPSRNISNSEWQTILSFFTSVRNGLDSFMWVSPFNGETYKVIFTSDLSSSVTAMNSSNTPTIRNIDSIVLREVA